MEIKRAALYARVSTSHQETQNQLIELRRFATARGWETTEFVDTGLSGALDADKRPSLRALMEAARKRRVDTVVVWDFSRFARSMRQLVEALDLFRAWGVSFISLREGIDTSTANGRLVFGIFASLAEFERELIRERVSLGLQRARTLGKKLGRPKVSLDASRATQLRQEGRSFREIALALETSKGTIDRLLKASQKPTLNPALQTVGTAA